MGSYPNENAGPVAGGNKLFLFLKHWFLRVFLPTGGLSGKVLALRFHILFHIRDEQTVVVLFVWGNIILVYVLNRIRKRKQMDIWNVYHMVAVSSTVTLPMVEGMVFSSWLMWWASSCQSTGGHQGTHVFLYATAVVCISEGSLSAGMGFWHFKPDRTLDRTGWSIYAEEETHALCSLAFSTQAHQNLAVQFRLISVFRSQWSDMYWRNSFLCTWLDELLGAAPWCQINASFNV